MILIERPCTFSFIKKTKPGKHIVYQREIAPNVEIKIWFRTRIQVFFHWQFFHFQQMKRMHHINSNFKFIKYQTTVYTIMIQTVHSQSHIYFLF